MTELEKVIKGLETIKQFFGYGLPSTAEMFDSYYGTLNDAVALLKEQEAENGEWITIWQEDDPDTSIHARCSICNRISERPLGGYCKWCGAKMNQEWGVDG